MKFLDGKEFDFKGLEQAIRKYADNARAEAERSAVVAPSPIADWREREFLTIQVAAKVLGLSSASIYRLAHEGRITLRKLAGRTVVPTRDIQKIADAAEMWESPRRGAAAQDRYFDRMAKRRKDAGL